MRKFSNPTAYGLAKRFTRNAHDEEREYTYIILGRSGPTGKTWLCNELKVHGLNAVEISEDIFDLVHYKDDENHCTIDDFRKCVVIVLNQFLNI